MEKRKSSSPLSNTNAMLLCLRFLNFLFVRAPSVGIIPLIQCWSLNNTLILPPVAVGGRGSAEVMTRPRGVTICHCPSAPGVPPSLSSISHPDLLRLCVAFEK